MSNNSVSFHYIEKNMETIITESNRSNLSKNNGGLAEKPSGGKVYI